MTTAPLTKWKCDVCGQTVDKDRAYVLWSTTDGASNFRIIHRGECDDRSASASAAITDFLGADGLANLTSMMSFGPVHAGKGKPAMPDADQFVDFVRRVQLPYYEEAREQLSSQEFRDDYSDANELRPYMQDVLQRLANA